MLLVFGDNVARSWKQIIYFNRPGDGDGAAKAGDATDAATDAATGVGRTAEPLPVPDAPPVPEPAALAGLELVRDERGVRLARETEEAD